MMTFTFFFSRIDLSRRLSHGGHYKPRSCVSHQKVAIIVSFRNRPKHLNVFLNHMHPFLQNQNLGHTIFTPKITRESAGPTETRPGPPPYYFFRENYPLVD